MQLRKNTLRSTKRKRKNKNTRSTAVQTVATHSRHTHAVRHLHSRSRSRNHECSEEWSSFRLQRRRNRRSLILSSLSWVFFRLTEQPLSMNEIGCYVGRTTQFMYTCLHVIKKSFVHPFYVAFVGQMTGLFYFVLCRCEVFKWTLN